MHKPGPTGHFPYPGTAQWALCTPSHLPTPALTINTPPPPHHPLPTASSTSLFKWEIMQMSTHHCSTPHISDVHWGKSVVCLWESAHGCFYLLSNGRGLNTQSTSQVFEAIWWYFFYQSRAAMLFFTFSRIIWLFYPKYVSKMSPFTSGKIFLLHCREISRLTK